MIWLVVLGFVLGFLIAVPLVSVFWAFAFSLTALRGKTYTVINKTPKWIDQDQFEKSVKAKHLSKVQNET